VLLDRVGRAVDAALAVPGEVEHRLAQGLAGDGAGVDAHAAHHRLALHDGHALIQLGRLDGRPLAGRAGTDDQHIVVVGWRCHRLLRNIETTRPRASWGAEWAPRWARGWGWCSAPAAG